VWWALLVIAVAGTVTARVADRSDPSLDTPPVAASR
jgi:hypothetical protein